jgi:uncharacterized membrane protein YadS
MAKADTTIVKLMRVALLAAMLMLVALWLGRSGESEAKTRIPLHLLLDKGWRSFAPIVVATLTSFLLSLGATLSLCRLDVTLKAYLRCYRRPYRVPLPEFAR